MRVHWLFLIAIFVACVIPLGAQQKSMPDSKATAAKFAMLSDEFMKASLALSPTNASQAGYHQHRDRTTGKTIELDAQLDDVGASAVNQQLQFYRGWRTRFHNEVQREMLDAEDGADWQLVDDQISLALLDLEKIQSFRHNPTGYVELLGSALFLPMSQNYAPAHERINHVLSRIDQIPRFVDQAKQVLVDADPIFISTAIDENAGNIDLIEHTVKEQIPVGSDLASHYAKTAPPAIAALTELSRWLKNDLAKRPHSTTWRLGKPLYAEKFLYVMQTSVTPDQILADAEQELKAVRAQMLEVALPLHHQMYQQHSDHHDLAGQDRENKIISEVLDRIADEHANRNHLIEAVKADLDSITQFIREKKIVGLSDRGNLKVIPTPPFMRGIYSVAGFHNAPPLEPTADAQYWVTPIDPKLPEAQAESKLREYNNYALKWLTIHEALPGHYVQFEHANSVEPLRRRLLRSLYSNGPYVEGWAEYIAQVMMEEGFLNNDPKFRMVMGKIRLRVVSNTILDVRMQTLDMTDQQAMDLMVKQCFQTQAEADGKLLRIKLSSGQLPTYYVGIRDWLTLRKDYKAKMGAKFNLKEFHDRVLDQGPIPIALLRTIILGALN